MKNFFYIFLPILFLAIFIKIVNNYQNDFGKSVSIIVDIVQSLAVIIGGLWAYRKFGWEKKCENIIKLKFVLEEYVHIYNICTKEYFKHNSGVDNQLKFFRAVGDSYISLKNEIHTSYYLPVKIRKSLFKTVSEGRKLIKYDQIDNTNKKFNIEIEEIYKKFDKITEC